MQFFITNVCFFDISVSKTYYGVSHSIIFIIDYGKSSTIDDFIKFYLALDQSQKEKLTLLIYRRFPSSSNIIGKSCKDLFETLSAFNDPNNKNSVQKLKALIKVYKIVCLYIRDFSELKMSNSVFKNFIGFQMLKKSQKKAKWKAYNFKYIDSSITLHKQPSQLLPSESRIASRLCGAKPKRHVSYRTSINL